MPGRGRGRGRAPPTGGRLFLMRSAEECGYDARNLRSLQDITRPELFPPMLLHSSGDNKKLDSTENDQPSVTPQQQQQQQGQNGEVTAENGIGDTSEAASASASADSQTPPTPQQQQQQQPSSSKPANGIKRNAQTLYLITKGREIHHRIQDSAFNVKTTKDVPDIIRYSYASKPPPITDASTVLSHCLRGRKRTVMGYFIPEELVSGQKLGSSSGMDVGGGGGGGGTNNNAGGVEPRDGVGRPRLGSVDNADGGGGEEEEFEGDFGSEDEGEDYVADYYASEDEDLDGDNEATF